MPPFYLPIMFLKAGNPVLQILQTFITFVSHYIHITMYRPLILFLLSALLTTGCNRHATSPESQNERLYFDKPARIWEETLPLGNGRLGMMPDGGIFQEKIVLNEISLWSGSEADYSNPEAAGSLPLIQQLLLEGRNREAQELMYRTFVPRIPSGNTYGSYQILGNLVLTYHYRHQPDTSGYHRILQLNEALATTEFGREKFRREYFVSRPDNVMAVHLDFPENTGITAVLSRPERASTHARGQILVMEGELDSGQAEKEGMKYIVYMQIVAPEGKVSVTDSSIEVTDTPQATLFISAATDYNDPGYREQAARLLRNALSTSYASLKNRHTDAHRELYDRVQVFIGQANDSLLDLTTDKRIGRFSREDDPALAALYLQYGRYLLISSTRPGCLPPNLQGLWANTIQTPWNGDYHTNINVQMNHWPLEPGNLSELYEPLISLTESLVPSGEKTARIFYGPQARGWVVHMMTNPWKYTVPGEHPSWGATNTAGAWLCAHLWEHYLYTGDKDYLRRIYPVLKGAADFFLSTMIEEPEHHWLVTAPTSSPENEFYMGNDPTPVSVCMGPAMDIQLVKELWSNTLTAARTLRTDSIWCGQLANAYRKLPPPQISKEGYLMEWLEDYQETDIHHRHVSHLYGLYPGNQITPSATPELADACKATLNRRGDAGTGWSRAWKINFWARLQDGNRAYKLFHSLLTPAIRPDGRHQGGTFPNLFCAHPPFQIDGNFGGASGIMEMLLQSHAGFIQLLPALPDSWKEGYFKGLCVRGGIAAGLRWESKRPRTLTLLPRATDTCRLMLPQGTREISVNGKKEDTSGKTSVILELTQDRETSVTFTY